MNTQSEMDGSQQYPRGGDAPAFCLGHPSHTLQPGNVICRICGALAANTTIGAYRVQKRLGIGRGGYTYLALHTTSRQPVCVKVTRPEAYHAQQLVQWEAARREIRSVTSLRHSAILPVFSCTIWQADTNKMEQMSSGADYAQQGQSLPVRLNGNSMLLTLSQYVPGTLPYFVAHYQKRETRQLLQSRNISPTAILLKLILQIGSALQTVHSRSITHGAIVPGNILLASYERCWLADFGIAKLHAPPVPYLPPELYGPSNASTQGALDAYWRSLNPLSDQFMFAMLCQQLLSQILQPGEYEPFLPVLQRATQARPERRYSSMDQLLQDLQNMSSSPSWSMSANNQQQSSNSGIRPNSPDMPDKYTPVPFASGVTPVIGLSPSTPLLGDPNVSPETPGAPSTALTPFMAQPATPPNQGQGAPLNASDWEKQGDRLFTQRSYEEALKAYHRSIEILNSKAATWLALGDTYFALQRHKEALMAYEQAMYLNPNDPQAWSSRGTVLDIMGKHQEAIDCYDRAEQLQLT